MKTRRSQFITLAVCTILLTPLIWKGAEASANNITISTAALTGQVNGSHTFVQFDLAWENSWRLSAGPSNWDAAWVFVKYKIDGGASCTAGAWKHATLSATDADHSVTTDNGTAAAINAVTGGTGVFMYRAADGTGNINWQGTMLRWNYAADGIADGCMVTVKVFAIEMVYVPQGSFYVGDGNVTNIYGQFEAGTSSAPYQVTGEGAITLGGGGANLGNNNAAGEWAWADDFDDATTQTLPAAFPKGYNAFYCMKYECSQEQYMEFLNTLTAPQQLARHRATAAGQFMTGTSTVSNTNRNGVKCKVLPVGVNVGLYVCDFDNDGVDNETASDGKYLPMGYTNNADFLAYLDWSGLRPMTELEYEKACRGDQFPVIAEYAWGTTDIYASSYSAGTNLGADNELPKTPTTIAGKGNCAYSTTCGSMGPWRCGIFATASTTKENAGASYYGIMEMSGSLNELACDIGQPTVRVFTGLHGDGTITAAGIADVTNWPSQYFMPRGGSYRETALRAGVAGRYNNIYVDITTGIRGIRTAP